ncbi:MAG: class I SAM-dependent methyltransferase [candidate division KSB1 bacterium]|nr:class I SAM-dependent methyltransferase [candidate division KSB1 bacterium]
MNAVYDSFSLYYDLEYGLKDNDFSFYLSYGKTFKSVLEVGAGTGRIALYLAEHGVSVTGIDNSFRMLEIAKEKAAQTTGLKAPVFIQADMRDFNLNRTFPCCIVPFRALLHNLTQDDQIAALQCIARHLDPGGLLVFDLFVPLYQVMAQKEWHEELSPEDLADPDENIKIRIDVSHDPVVQQLSIRNEYVQLGSEESRSAIMKYRYMFRYEVEALLRLCGFETQKVWSDFDKSPYNYSSGMMIFQAKKKGKGPWI